MNPITLISLLAAAMCLSACASTQLKPGPDVKPAALLERSVTIDGVAHRFAIWVPASYTPKTPSPRVLFLHGSGECGEDGLKQTKVGIYPAAQADPAQWSCIIVMPQKPVQNAQWEQYESLVLATLDAATHELNIDKKRTSLTGLSQGGHGTWIIGAHHPDLFSAFAPLCGYGNPKSATGVNIPPQVAPALAGRPVWAFHGEKDDVVSPEESKQIVAAIKNQHKSPEPRLTLFPDANHNCWDKAYREEKLGQWLTSQVRP